MMILVTSNGINCKWQPTEYHTSYLCHASTLEKRSPLTHSHSDLSVTPLFSKRLWSPQIFLWNHTCKLMTSCCIKHESGKQCLITLTTRKHRSVFSKQLSRPSFFTFHLTTKHIWELKMLRKTYTVKTVMKCFWRSIFEAVSQMNWLLSLRTDCILTFCPGCHHDMWCRLLFAQI